MKQDELRALGHEPMSPLQALRLRCLDCCAGSAHEVKLCTAVKCPAWPFRLGTSPWRAPMSEERKAAARAHLALARKVDPAASEPDEMQGSSAKSPGP
jgi:hypothetical protein